MSIRWAKVLGGLILSGLLIFNGCGIKEKTAVPAENASASGQKALTIATSFYPMYIFTLNVAKDIPDVKVVNMTKPTTGCLHDYAITTEDMKNLEGAQFLVINGAGMESFLDKVTGQMPQLKIIDASKGINLLQDETGYNPHVWVSISKAITQVQNIGEQLAAQDPAHASEYKENTAAYVAKLEAERTRMHQALDGIKNRDILTFHEAFPYFAQEFNLNIVGVIEREPGSEPNAKELAETIAQVKALQVKALFAEPQYPAKVAEAIARETGAKIYTLDPVVTGPMDPDAYINIMEQNLQTLKEALQ